jgi:hypothetical protein
MYEIWRNKEQSLVIYGRMKLEPESPALFGPESLQGLRMDHWTLETLVGAGVVQIWFGAEQTTRKRAALVSLFGRMKALSAIGRLARRDHAMRNIQFIALSGHTTHLRCQICSTRVAGERIFFALMMMIRNEKLGPVQNTNDSQMIE